MIVYNQDGYIPQNDRKVYSFNNLTAKPNCDGSVTIQFGGCGDANANCIPIVANEDAYLVANPINRCARGPAVN